MHADAQAHGYIHYTIAGTGGQTAARVDEQLKAEFGYDNNDIAASCSVSSDFFQDLASERYRAKQPYELQQISMGSDD